MITETEMQMYNLFKEKGLLNQNLIRKEMAIPETIQEVESLSDYDSDLSETSVTASNESVMADLVGLFAESETEIPETKRVRAENSPFTILSQILLLVSQKFVKSEHFLQYYEESVVDKFKWNLLPMIFWLNIINYNS
jgi:hypothetical protein